MIKEKESSRGRNGFTLVELLAVIVILAIILVIAVSKVMSINEDVLWNLGSTPKSDIVPLSTMYMAEINTQTYWFGKIGLIYTSDYAYASADIGCDNNIYGSTSCINNNWLNPNDGSYRAITPYNLSDGPDGVWKIEKTGTAGTSSSFASSVRPVLYLKPEIKVISGNGDDKPYILGL